MLAFVSRSSFVSLVFLFGAILSACGGGGGGEGGSGNDTGVSINTTGIAINAVRHGDLPSSMLFNISWSNPSVAEVIVGVPPDDPIPSWIKLSLSGSTSPMSLDVGVNSTNMSVGTYNMTLRIVSGDQNGNLVNFVDVPLTYNVYPQVTASPTSLTMSTFEGVAASDATVSLNSTGALPSYTADFNFFGAASFLDVSTNNNVITVHPNSTALSLTPGTYTVSLRILLKYSDSYSRHIFVPINYSVGNALSAPAQINIPINGSTLPAELTRNYSVASNTGMTINNISTSIDVNWANVSTTGNTSSVDNLTVSIPESEIPNLGVGTHNATITVSSTDTNVSTIAIPVAVSISLPSVSKVAPYISYSNRSDTVLVIGSGFSGLTAQVDFNTTNALSVDVISDNRMLVRHDALAAGEYTLNITNIGGLASPTTGLLKVIDEKLYTETAISSTGYKREVVYDNERKVLYVADTTNNELERYAYNAQTGNWDSSTPLSFSDLRDIAMARDGSVLIALTGQRLYTVTPDTFVATARATNPDTFGGRYFRYVETTNNGMAIIATGLSGSGYTSAYRFNLQTYNLAALESFYFATLGSSLDGEKVLFVQGSLSPPPAVYMYNADGDTITSTGLSSILYALGGTEMNRHATQSLINNSLYDSGFTQLGTLMYAIEGVLSPDNNYAYMYDYSIGTYGTIRIFDLTSPDGSGGYNELAGITLNTTPGTRKNGALSMTIASDGKTIFLAGDANILVIPVP